MTARFLAPLNQVFFAALADSNITVPLKMDLMGQDCNIFDMTSEILVTESCISSRMLSKSEKCGTENCQQNNKTAAVAIHASRSYGCPKKPNGYTCTILLAVLGKLYIFSDGKVWTFKDRRPEVAVRIGKIFSHGPNYVNASVSTQYQTYLIKDRTIFAFEVDKTTEHKKKQDTRNCPSRSVAFSFRIKEGWPKVLQNNILFFPQAAFPIKNGSAIIASGDVFATYNFMHNEVSLIGDLTIHYPNLPADFRSGIPYPSQQFEMYHFIGIHTLYEYDMHMHQIIFAQPLKKYLLC
ncbi:unnamed protein product [Thelazia callipaeda]|uniref:Peptidase A1 domain-containing protein n=1 Tax=Thelazia callipaeda TaxID=103827 RepID=A0A0N5D377_THECL|nr:unnamed protein product [Thelazia callipaeda]